MEQAIYFSNLNKLKSHKLSYDRIYFGNEFCDRLIPSPEELEEALCVAKEDKKSFSFVTCYVSECEINRYYVLLELLARMAPSSEIIINDFGLLEICLQNNLTPVLGRLLVRQRRDPRALKIIGNLSSSAKSRLQQTGLNDYALRFLMTRNIKRIELDNLLQGIDIDELKKTDFSYSVYIPYGYVSTTRICFLRNRNRNKEERFNIVPCSLECRNGIARLHSKNIKAGLFMKGNTVFFQNTSLPFLNSESKIDRIVYEPEIPD